MESLGIDPIIIGAQIVNFVLLVFILNKFLYKPVLRAIKAKNAEVAEIAKSQDIAEKEVMVAREKAEKTVKAAVNEKAEILKTSRQEAQKNKKEVLAKAQAEAEQILAKSKKELAAEKKKLSQAYNADVLSTALLINKKVLSNMGKKALSESELKKALSDLGKIETQAWKN